MSPSRGAGRRCLACGGSDLRPLLAVDDVPAVVGALWPSQDAARQARLGRLELVVCDSCSHVENVAFDASLVDYDACYDSSLHFSPTFRSYAERLADHLAAAYDLRGKVVLEVGSGKGEFLRLLCEKGAAIGVGYDPTYAGESDGGSVRFVSGMYPLDGAGEAFDLLVCRHVLEHLESPYALLRGLRASCRHSASALYLEVPNGEFTLSRSGQWDLIYPHVSYFTPASLRRLVERSGFEVVGCGVAFDGQFLSVEAEPSNDTEAKPSDVTEAKPSDEVEGALGASRPVQASVKRMEEFAATYLANVVDWRQRLATVTPPQRGAAVWGAGAKGATFLNTVGRDSRVVAVIDINPRKWGRFVPGTGHEVSAPESLRGRDIDTVVVVNDSYRREISDHLHELGITADVISV